MCYAPKKTDILPLPTLAYDESTIASTFDILQKLIQVLRLTKEVICEKLIILKDDLLKIQIATQAILKKEDKPHNLH